MVAFTHKVVFWLYYKLHSVQWLSMYPHSSGPTQASHPRNYFPLLHYGPLAVSVLFTYEHYRNLRFHYICLQTQTPLGYNVIMETQTCIDQNRKVLTSRHVITQCPAEQFLRPGPNASKLESHLGSCKLFLLQPGEEFCISHCPFRLGHQGQTSFLGGSG